MSDLDKLVSEKVMGQKWDESRCRVCGWPIEREKAVGCMPGDCSMRPVPDPPMYEQYEPYTSDPRCDYKVLLHVRETWGVVDLSTFTFWLNEIQRLKAHRLKFSTLDPWINYEPGDFSRAALKAMGV